VKNIVISSADDACHAAVYHFVEVANKVQNELAFRRRLLSEEQRRRVSANHLYDAEVYNEAFHIKREFELGDNDLFLLVVNGNIYDDEDDEYFYSTGPNNSAVAKREYGVAIISLFFLNSQSTFMKDGGTWWTSLGKTKQARKMADCILLLILCAVAEEIGDLVCHKEMRRCIMDFCQNPTEIVEAANGKFQFCAQECFTALSLHPNGQALLRIAQSLSDALSPIHILDPEPATQILRADSVVISVHGIRTRGDWQKMLTSELNAAGFKHEPLDYGFFRAVQLLIPSRRARQVTWFLNEYTRVSQPPERKVSVIAHSFGTYIVVGALEQYVEVKLDSIILCGSIVRRDFAWSRLIPSRVRCVLNDYGRLDSWVKFAEWFILDAGPSGAKGFIDDASGQVQQRFRPRFRHSSYFYRLNYRDTWIPFLKGESVMLEASGETHVLNRKFLATNVVVIVLILGLILWHLLR
jgi:hypothetical protein